MNPELSAQPSLLVGKGRLEIATYKDPQIPNYQDNPLIEALPKILTSEEALTKLAHYPSYDPVQRTWPSHLRVHLIQSALQFFAPLPVHLDLEQRFSRLIRTGYQARNPQRPSFWGNLNQRVMSLSQEGSVSHLGRSTANGFTIIGMSGVGKTVSVESILSLYPQVIIHNHYRNRDFTHQQLVWLKLDCPFDGSIRGLCLNFFQAVDDLLGTQYYKNYQKGRPNVDALIPLMARVASLHCLGALVIDEIQHLSSAKSGGASLMLNFFVQLVNTIGVPVILVGTYKAWSVLSGEFRSSRRGTGQGDLIWDRMANDEIWQLFIESLWRYQYVQKLCPLTPTFSQVLYEVTQGITDLAVKVYVLAQLRAITTGKEVITKAIIQSVARDSLRLVNPVLNALKTGMTQQLQGFEDVHPIELGTFFQEAISTVQKVDYLNCLKASTTKSVDHNLLVATSLEQQGEITQSTSLAAAIPETLPLKTSSPRRKITNKPQLITRETANNATTLIEIVTIGTAHQISGYEALKLAGLIQPTTEY